MGILDRMARIIRANVNDMLDGAEDPEKMLNELIREMDDSIREAHRQVAEMIAQEKVMEAEYQESMSEANEWQRKAELAVGKGRDDLAREALRRKRDAENLAEVYSGQVIAQQDMVNKLRQQLRVLEQKHVEAQSKRDLLIARHRRTQAQQKLSQTFSSLPDMSAMAELDRMEKRIRLDEARADAYVELETDSMDWQFTELEMDSDIESDLLALKSSLNDETTLVLEDGELE